MLYTKFQPNISSGSGEKVDLVVLLFLAIFFIPEQPEFIILKPFSLVMLHVKFKNHGCNGFRELSHLNGLKC